jgi:hypothetical protein
MPYIFLKILIYISFLPCVSTLFHPNLTAAAHSAAVVMVPKDPKTTPATASVTTSAVI